MPLELYEVLHKIGYGKYSSVYKVKRLHDHRLLALKKIALSKMTLK
jgi:serine/threonine protein kinase